MQAAPLSHPPPPSAAVGRLNNPHPAHHSHQHQQHQQGLDAAAKKAAKGAHPRLVPLSKHRH